MKSARRSMFGRAGPDELFRALALAAVGGLGALPLTGAGPQPMTLLVWLALWAPVAGVLAGAWGLGVWPVGLVVPAVWMLLVAFVDGLAPGDLPTPLYAAMAWSGLFLAGLGIGAAAARSPWRAAGWTAAVCGLLAALPVATGAFGEPLPARLAARALDLSPATWLAECAGVDWARHPPVYSYADTVRMDPSVRTAFRGFLAGPTALLLGLGLALAGRRLRRSQRAAAPSQV